MTTYRDTNLLSSELNEENPFPGLKAFVEADAAFFHGRGEEIQELFNYVQRQCLTVLCGKSGIGKSSILQAGLIPKLKKDNYFPIYIRFDFSDSAPDLLQQIKDQIISQINSTPNVEAAYPKVEQTLWEYFHEVLFWEENFNLLTPVLIFDQFEELFTKVNKATLTGDLLEEFTNIIENYIPAEVEKEIKAGKRELNETWRGEPHVKVIISLREDYLAKLQDWGMNKTLIAKGQYLLPEMNALTALEAIQKQGESVLDETAAFGIIKSTIHEAGHPIKKEDLLHYTVELAILSLFCHELNGKRKALGLKQITKEVLEKQGAKEILTSFYQNVLKEFDEGVQRFLEDCLVTESGQRDIISLETALHKPGIDEKTIIKLIGKRAIRKQERLHGQAYLELIHDLLGPVVQKSREERKRRELLTEKNIAIKREQLRAEKEALQRQKIEIKNAELDRKNRKLKISLFCIICLALICLGTTIRLLHYKNIASQNAQNARQYAEQKELESNRSKKLAGKYDSIAKAKIKLAKRLGKVNNTLRSTQDSLYFTNSMLIHENKEKQQKNQELELAKQQLQDNNERLREEINLKNLALEQTEIEKSSKIAAFSEMFYAEDPTLSFRLAEQALYVDSTHPTKVAVEAFKKAIWNGPFYYSVLGFQQNINRLFLAPDGNNILVQGQDHKIHLIDAMGNSTQNINSHEIDFKHFHQVNYNALLTKTDIDTTLSWHIRGRMLKDLKIEDLFNTPACFAKSIDGSLYAAGFRDKKVVIYNERGSIVKILNHEAEIEYLAFSKDNRFLLTRESDMRKEPNVHVWNVKNGSEVSKKALKNHKYILTTKVDKSGQFYAVADNNEVYVYEFPANLVQVLKNTYGHRHRITDLDISLDGSLILTASEKDHTIKVWNWRQSENPVEEYNANLSSQEPNRVKFSPNNNLVVVQYINGPTRIWDRQSKSQKPSYVLQGDLGVINDVVISKFDQKAIVASEKGLHIFSLIRPTNELAQPNNTADTIAELINRKMVLGKIRALTEDERNTFIGN